MRVKRGMVEEVVETEGKRQVVDARVLVGALICGCFLLGSTGWLSWLYRITELADPAQVDFFTMVVGYVAQVVGIGVFMLIARWQSNVMADGRVEGTGRADAGSWDAVNGRVDAKNRDAASDRSDANGQIEAAGSGKAPQAKRWPNRVLGYVTVASLVLYLVLLATATLSDDLAPVLASGWLMNVFCGIAQGYYLTCLAGCVEKSRRGIVFGGGYAASTAVTWLLSVVAGGAATTGVVCLVVCAALAVGCAVLVWRTNKELSGNWPTLGSPTAIANDAGATVPNLVQGVSHGKAAGPEMVIAPAMTDLASNKGSKSNLKPMRSPASSASLQDDALSWDSSRRSFLSLVVLASVTVVLASLVKNAGFSFPTSDLSGVVDLELSRLFYGVGLVIAGVAADRDRRYAFVCCVISLAVPFFMLALTGAGASSVILWAIGYLLFGFFVVFRVTLFADLAAKNGVLWLAGAGLLFGRVGDVLGTSLFLLFGDEPLTLIVVTAVLFAVSMWLMLRLYQRLYVSVAIEPQEQQPPRDVLGEFCVRYGLSTRERQVLPLLVEGKTNAEIAAELFVTESTIKYHVRNIREKTGCKTRLEVADLYIASRGQ